tara:strand:- start:4572 stop:7133 length:2562 start_codon:yes stop_codon:yes gene_type:complete
MASTFYKSGSSTSVAISGTLSTSVFPSGYTSANIIQVDIGTDITSIADYTFFEFILLTSVTIPHSITVIGSGVFAESGLTSITIPNSILTIGEDAFNLCSSLSSVIFESNSSLTQILGGSFWQTALASIDLPPTLTSIGSGAFNIGPELLSVTFGGDESVLSYIADNAFANDWSLTSLSIPSTVKQIINAAFSGLSGLETVIFGSNFQPTNMASNTFSSDSDSIQVYMSSNTLYYLNDKYSLNLTFDSTFSQSFFGAANVAIILNPSTTFTKIDSSTVTSSISGTISSTNYPVGWVATDISSVDIGTQVTSIGPYAFQNASNMTSVFIPNSVTIIDIQAFETTSNLTSVIIPSSVTDINANAFDSSGLVSLTIPSTVTTIGEYAFASITSLKNVTIYTSAAPTNGGRMFFGSPNIETATLDFSGPIANNILANRVMLTSVTLLNVTSIGFESFAATSTLTSINIPNTVTDISGSAFASTTILTTVTFDSGSALTTIGESAFQSSGLTSIVILSSVTSIEESAFQSCSSLTSVTFDSGSALTTIGDSAFKVSGLTSIVIPSLLTSIGIQAFSNASSLTSVTFEPGSLLTSIGSEAFWYTSSLTSIVMPNSVTYIENGTFSYSGLQSIIISKTVTYIGSDSFSNCTSLTSFTFENDSQLTEFGNNAFENASALPSITIPNSVITIRQTAFKNCQALASVTFEPNCLPTTFFPDAFTASGLTTVYMSSNTLNHLNSIFTPPTLFFGLNPLFFGANNVTIFSTDPSPPPIPPPISNRPGPIQYCTSRFAKCNLNKKTKFSSGNVTIQGATNSQRTSIIVDQSNRRGAKLVTSNQVLNVFGRTAGGPGGFGAPPRNHF